NIGFVEDRAIYIDTGHITKHSNVNLRERMRFEFEVRLAPFHDWLKVRYPVLAEYFVLRQHEILSVIPSEPLAPKNMLSSKEAKALKSRKKHLKQSAQQQQQTT